MSGRDRAGCVVLSIVTVALVLLALVYAAGRHRLPAAVAPMEIRAPLLTKRIELPPNKGMFPVTFVLVVDVGGKWRGINVDYATYRKAAVGMTVVRDRSGNITLEPAK